MADNPRQFSFAWREHEVPVQVRVSARAKRARLVVRPHGVIEVVVPRGFREGRVGALIDSHRPWLERTLARMGGPRSLERPESLQLAALGEQWQVHSDAGAPACRGAGGTLQLRHRNANDWREPLLRWLARRGRETLVPWLERVGAETGLTFGRASVRGQKTRWGSCSQRGTISLNYRLLFLEPAVVRYLLIHELCHTRHMNHSPHFWALVALHDPDYRRHDRALRDAGRRIPVWALPH